MGLLDPRVVLLPYEYTTAYDYWLKQQQAHWLHQEVPFSADVDDFNLRLSESEKQLVGQILKGFAVSETFIGDFWSHGPGKWFKKPEIQMMSNTFASFESIHAVAYSYLNTELGIIDFAAFLHDESTKAKIDRLINTRSKTRKDIALSLAVFSAFNEGVSLFSSFAILLNFKRFNKLKGVGTIIEWSIRDESLHSEAGCWLFNTFVSEYPELWTDELKKELYDAARLTIQLEDDYIDRAFSFGEIEGIDAYSLKQYMRLRCNTKLNDIGLKKNWKNIDMEAAKSITSWFDLMAAGEQFTDFFSTKPTNYSKSVISFDKIWE